MVRVFDCVLQIWGFLVLILLLYCELVASYPQIYPNLVSRDDQSMVHSYDRLDEVKKECKSVLSVASDFASDDNRNRVYKVKNELNFVNGDWEQESGGAPLIPFDDRDMSKRESGKRLPVKLVSFWVTDVDEGRRYRNAFPVNGMLSLGITRNGTFSYRPYENPPHFQVWPGTTQLSILFQGFYIELEKNGGEHVMCLLGSAVLPSRLPESADPWEWVRGSGSNSYPPLLQDDQLLLVLRYPKTLTLTSRAVHGEMRSLNEKSNLKYFDKVLITSQLGPYANYEFISGKLVSKACDPYPYKDALMSGGIDVYKGSEFCGILDRFTSGEALTVVANWKCNGTDEYCSRLGPFMSQRDVNATDGGFNNVKLLMHDVRCEPHTGQRNSSYSKVSAVFRAISPFENHYTAAERTGLSNMTLSVEGIWNSSDGQLCMIGCLGSVGTKHDTCVSRVCLYVPVSFSIKQRSIVVGTMSSINEKTPSFFPLSFEKMVQPSELWDRFGHSHLSYKYSKIDLAGAFLERSEPFDFGTVIKKSFLSYPAMEDGPDLLTSLSVLAEDLTLHASAISEPPPKSRPWRTSIQVEILSLGSLFGRYWSMQNVSTVDDGENSFHAKVESTEKQLLLNVSAQLTTTGPLFQNISVLFLEGLYDSRVGRMFLIGCRDVRASWKILSDSTDLENGLDCLVEVKLEYPPKTARWLANPTAKISISSKRNDDDPLHFGPINLQTLPILYRKQREDILSRRGIEGFLRILTLSLAIGCISSQLLYIRDKVDDLPYMSLVMLGVQALGYSIPLITGAEAIFKKMASESDEYRSYYLEKSQWVYIVDYTVKLLVLVAFLLTLRLFQKVWKSRIRLLTRTPLEPRRVPSDRQVLFTTLVIHAVGFIIILIVHAMNSSQRLRSQKIMDSRGNTSRMQEWEIELEEYVGLVQDFFLLPQIIGNVLWQIHCIPLRKIYFMGITIVRLLPHVYDYMRTPVFNPYFSEEYEFVNPSLDFYSRFGDIAIPVTAFVLVFIVYIQQKCGYGKLSETLSAGQLKLLPLGSKVYERLPSIPVEAELVSGTNGSDENGRRKVDDE
ncbi:hypothetical protein Sjap_019117 [Stephania japonica]|uniref:RING-type E3 ubiquitin transferase n=1 Tax=Stephania japonica TaxID=461633 RepID=A0AAP0HUF4_9MAGN